MDRRKLILSGAAVGLSSVAGEALARQRITSEQLPPAQPINGASSSAPARSVFDAPQTSSPPPAPTSGVQGPAPGPTPGSNGSQPVYDTGRAQTYSADEMIRATSDFLGVTAESAGAAIEKIFKDKGQPTAYVAGEEGSGAFIAGLRYGRGLLYMKGRPTLEVFWQGPSVGWDWGGNASRVFTLCYNLQYPDAIFRRFPGVEGSAYLIGGLGVNYQKADEITLAPIRAGVGLRLGANIGYVGYSRKRRTLPF
ncbi:MULTISPECIES: EipA family protein [Caulobacter]|jgi:hypothetical protein|uniref:DUF1134 domain-containing protein n=1 Tax=Caulobacter vibrioides OR37 TaxID=1292034 RepID=R0EG74_CAUVI|nr:MULTISPECIES: EipA family protein [Caulobacter]ENZ80262.1 hypothetical protein OR37_03832 [Caulobacter vibrioides OR37]MBQ1561528.1 DUF1134 domain-containing protein [Caulobacter sp.]